MLDGTADDNRLVEVIDTDDGSEWLEVRYGKSGRKPLTGINNYGVSVQLYNPPKTKTTLLLLTIKTPVMQSFGCKIGDRAKLLIGKDFKSVKIKLSDEGNKVRSRDATNRVKNEGTQKPALLAFAVSGSLWDKIGTDTIKVPVKNCLVNGRSLIVRW
jgi:hypothetical protein